MAEENYQNQQDNGKQKYGYGKWPLWQWALIYVIIGGIAYGFIYYVFFAKSGDYNNALENNKNQTNTNTNSMETANNSYSIQGMKIEIEKEGSGEPAKAGDMVTVNYTGTLT